MDLREEVRKLLQAIGPGQMSITAYDTAWIARLSEIGEPIGEEAIEWLRENQLPDGSWGAKQPVYYHDRVVCTLAAINALSRRGRAQDKIRLQKAEQSLEKAIGELEKDASGETVGFEVIVPSLLGEAQALGALQRQKDKVLVQLTPYRAAKLAMLPDGVINRFVSTAFSAEMAGTDNQQLLDVENLQENNGSVGLSPSATAYFALYVSKRDTSALRYLRTYASNGKAPNAAPFDVFERSWVLWNLMLIDNISEDIINLCQPHLDFLEEAWIPGKGVGFAKDYTPKDSDDTSLVYEVLTHFGRSIDLDAVLHYEHVFYFHCYDVESTPSVSANIHVLGALRKAGLNTQHPAVQKILLFLKEVRKDKTFWFDKWHTSPYYATTQAIIACAGYADEIIENAILWILRNQNPDGSWGYYSPTAEETAYCLQALAIWEKHHKDSIPSPILEKGVDWLIKKKIDSNYPPLWIAKCLYCPELIVRSAILSALMLTKQSC